MSENRHINLKAPVVFVSDDARVIRMSELQELYEIAGGLRPLADALGVSITTVSRAIRKGSSADRSERVAAVLERLERTA